ncbi:hypothetical protein CSKR_200636, partial [Clonorchis sinensis]
MTYKLKSTHSPGPMFNRKSGKGVKAHTDIVRCFAQFGQRLYSAGFDRRLIVFDTSGAMEELLPIIKLVHNAHNGIISCLTTARVSNAVFLLLSGGFDRIVKIWDEEGQHLHTICSFTQPVLDIAYIPATLTLWVASAKSDVHIFDVRSYEEVTQLCGTFDGSPSHVYFTQMRLLKFCPEVNVLIGSTPRDHLVSWQYNSTASVSRITLDSGFQCATAPEDNPEFFYTLSTDNQMLRWERSGTSHFAFAFEEIMAHYSMEEKLSDSIYERLKSNTFRAKDLETFETLLPPNIVLKCPPKEKPMTLRPHTGLHKKQRKPSFTGNVMYTTNPRLTTEISLMVNHNRKKGFLRAVYIAQSETLICSCEDGVVYVFAYDYQGTRSFLMKTLDTGRPISDRTASSAGNPQPAFRGATENTAQSEKLRHIFKQLKAYEKGKSKIPSEQTPTEQAVEKGKVDEVTPDLFEPFNIDNSILQEVNRHSFGLKCHHALLEHKDCVTSLVLLSNIPNPHGKFTL